MVNSITQTNTQSSQEISELDKSSKKNAITLQKCIIIGIFIFNLIAACAVLISLFFLGLPLWLNATIITSMLIITALLSLALIYIVLRDFSIKKLAIFSFPNH
ncbi:hypothetical protein [Chlamydia sp. 17-3921]|uniref:hypothetical protein n=1 Tax=Chlamydia sp. 17-3921 TaxID=2675798 RepID=UPI001918B90B|nr:hypothetical protein [Chlamydia sp. 17-3921]